MQKFNPSPPPEDVKNILCMRELQGLDVRHFIITLARGLGIKIEKFPPRTVANLVAMKSREDQILWLLRRSPLVNKAACRSLASKKGARLLTAALGFADEMDARTKEKLLCSSPLAHVHDRLGTRPMVLVFGSKDETPSMKKFSEFWDHLAVRLIMLGIGLGTGLGPNVMEIAPRRFMELRPDVEAACKAANIEPLWKFPAPVAGITLNIDGEPISGCFDPGLHAGPFRTLEPRGMALLSLGCVVGALSFIGGDSTILEVLQTITAAKGAHQAALETPLRGRIPMILVDDAVALHEQGTEHDRRMWMKFLECYELTCNSRLEERRARKRQQLEKLQRWYLALNGGSMEEAAMLAFDEILVGASSVYGANPFDPWVRKNNIEEQMGVLVRRFFEGKPLR